jgi:hypothetical protein
MMLSEHVGSFTTPLDGQLARSALESWGIHARLEGDTLAGAAEWIQGSSNVRVFVSESDAQRAVSLLKEHEHALAEKAHQPDTLDESVARSFRLAIAGWILLPVVTQIVSAWQLRKVKPKELSPRVRRLYWAAQAFNLSVILVATFFLLFHQA